jgi:hypothetical protein
MMILLLDLPGLLRAALPALQERLARHPVLGGARADFGFQTAGQYARLAVAAGTVTADTLPSERTLTLEQDLFWRLFLGAAPLDGLAEELAAVAGVRFTAAETLLLNTLFPYQDPLYWWPDHF